MATTAGVSAFHHSIPSPIFSNKYNMGLDGHCRVPHGYAENRKLSWWVMNQRAQYQMLRQEKKSWLSGDRVWLLDSIGFEWNPTIAPRR
jgi:hypothetical protein